MRKSRGEMTYDEAMKWVSEGGKARPVNWARHWHIVMHDGAVRWESDTGASVLWTPAHKHEKWVKC